MRILDLRTALSVTLALVAGIGSAQAQTVIHVSPAGDDSACDGSRAKRGLFRRSQGPFRTLQRARDEMRTLRDAGQAPAGGFIVELEPGFYTMPAVLALTDKDSGAESAPVVFRAAERGTAVLSSGVRLDNWQAVSAPEILKRIDPKAAGKVYWTELSSELLDPIPGFANGGCGYRGKPEYPIGLYQSGERLPISRWPNEEFTKMGECLGHNEIHGHTGVAYTEGWFRFENERLARWVGEPDLWFDGLWFHHWADQKMALETIDPVEKTIRLKNGKSHAFGFKKGHEFFAFNAISEIDRPGEWAVDRTSRRIYLWPEDDLASEPVVASVNSGIVEAEKLAHVRFEGLVFENCLKTAVEIRDCTQVVVSGCTVRHTGSWGVNIQGGSDCTVIGCDLYDLGEGGVMANGGVRNSLTPANHLVENNHIHHFGRIVSTYRPGAALRGVGNKLRHNLIYQAQHQAIAFSGNDHLIEYNIAHDICLHSSDAGAIYACERNWTRRGTVIRHNLFHALGQGLDGCGCRAIYLDDFTSGVRVESNIVTLSDRGLNFGGGRDLIVEYNLALNCVSSLNLASRGIETFAKHVGLKGRESNMFKHLLKDEKLFRAEPWSTRYPTLLGPLDNPDPVDAHNAHYNTVRHNVNIGGGKMTVSNAKKVMRTCTVEDNIDFDEDPGFVDLAHLDFGLRPDSAIFARIPGFKAPDFAKMGLYDAPERATPAVKFGPGVTPMSPIMSPEEREKARLPVLAMVPPAPREIGIDGHLDQDEWPADQAAAVPEAKWDMNGTEVPLPSRIRLASDSTSLFIAVESSISADRRATRGCTWGKDDGVEIALAVAHSARLPNHVSAVVLRGYAGGHVESVTDGGLNETEAARAFEGVCYAATRTGKGGWTAEWKIPFASLGTDPATGNLPILAHITVRKPTEDIWAGWRKRWSRETWDVKGAYALCLQSFGTVAFVPGQRLSAVRIDVQGDRNAEGQSMEAGPGAEAPDWAQKWNRLVCSAGTVHADKWKDYRFEFTPREDATVSLEVMGTQTRAPAATVWTYYDDFHVEGAELINGDFEDVDDNGRIAGWNCVLDKNFETVAKGEAGVVNLGSGAASGTHAARTSHDHRVNQRIKITKGRKVTVTYKAKAVLPNLD